ncbi:MAG: flagellar basal body-associated FliL family protein [Defluviitaleaceae bacterium]|nr:flagellar basal body-associated FliL family protein [Defluviitaleaceae bacterium]
MENSKGNLMMVVIIVLLVALLGTVVGVAIFAFSAVQDLGSVAANVDFDRNPRVLLPNEIGRLPVGEPIVTNISGGVGSSGIARVQAVVGYDQTQGSTSNEMARTLDEQMDFIRGVVIESINSRTYAELSGTEGMRNLSAEVLETLQNAFRTNMIVDVTFREWVIQ